MTEIMRTRADIQVVIDALDYDFNAFNMEDFLQHIETKRKRRLIVGYVPFSPDLFGLWYPAPRTDYIFVNATLHPTHQVHTLLHEIAHMLLEHRGVQLQQVLGETLSQQLGIASAEGHLRAAGRVSNPLQEEEAEVFVLLIQRKLVTAHRLHELYSTPTSIPALEPYVDSLNFNS